MLELPTFQNHVLPHPPPNFLKTKHTFPCHHCHIFFPYSPHKAHAFMLPPSPLSYSAVVWCDFCCIHWPSVWPSDCSTLTVCPSPFSVPQFPCASVWILSPDLPSNLPILSPAVINLLINFSFLFQLFLVSYNIYHLFKSSYLPTSLFLC